MPVKNCFLPRAEEVAKYVEFLKRRNREREKDFYENKIKIDFEKYETNKNKCKKHNNIFIIIKI